MPEELRIFDALDQLRKLARFVDLAKLLPAFQRLTALFDGQPPLNSPGAVGLLIDEIVLTAHAVADATITDRDDAVVDGLTKIVNDTTLKPIIVSIIEWLLIDDGEPERMPVWDAQAFTTAGVDFPAVVEYLGELIARRKAWKGE